MNFSVTPGPHTDRVAKIVVTVLSLIAFGMAAAVSTSRAIARAVRLP